MRTVYHGANSPGYQIASIGMFKHQISIEKDDPKMRYQENLR